MNMGHFEITLITWLGLELPVDDEEPSFVAAHAFYLFTQLVLTLKMAKWLT